MIDTLIFDFDGVIIDTETPDFDTWQEVFRNYGVELERTWWTGFIGGSSGRMDVCGLLEELTGREFDRDSLMRDRRRRYLAAIASSPLLPGVVEYIHEARRLGLKLAVASSSSHAWVDGHLESRGLRQHFDAVICSDDVARVKPDPELYLLTASTLGDHTRQHLGHRGLGQWRYRCQGRRGVLRRRPQPHDQRPAPGPRRRASQDSV